MEKLVLTQQEKFHLEKLGVEAVVLFGSHAEGLAKPFSDYDFGVIVSDASILYSSKKRGSVYDTLYDILSSHIKKLVDIDIVFLETAPFELRSHVMKHGRPIFEVKPGIFADFKEMVIEQYADFAPLRSIFHKGVLSQIP